APRAPPRTRRIATSARIIPQRCSRAEAYYGQRLGRRLPILGGTALILFEWTRRKPWKTPRGGLERRLLISRAAVSIRVEPRRSVRCPPPGEGGSARARPRHCFGPQSCFPGVFLLHTDGARRRRLS